MAKILHLQVDLPQSKDATCELQFGQPHCLLPIVYTAGKKPTVTVTKEKSPELDINSGRPFINLTNDGVEIRAKGSKAGKI